MKGVYQTAKTARFCVRLMGWDKKI